MEEIDYKKAYEEKEEIQFYSGDTNYFVKSFERCTILKDVPVIVSDKCLVE